MKLALMLIIWVNLIVSQNLSKPQFLYQEMGIMSCVRMVLAFIRKYFVRQHSGCNIILIFKEE